MRIGFVSTRFAGTDGVSLESAKWAHVFAEAGHDIAWFSGLSDRPEDCSRVVPTAHFDHPDIQSINRAVWQRDELPGRVAAEVEALRHSLKSELSAFIADFGIDLLIPQNALTIPMHIPLGLALSDLIAETGIPTIAHHHDFYWERERFSGAATANWLREAFPPRHPSIQHVVINSAAKRELLARFQLDSTVVPNVMDFSSPPAGPDEYAAGLREAIGLGPEDRLILQPTRIIPRKGIELSIELLARLNDPRNKLVISHDSGDEGHDYLHSLTTLATTCGVDLRLIGHLIATERTTQGGQKRYTLQDLYPVADFVTFPSLYEGFGNALLEAIQFGKPLLVNRYSVFKEDIEPVGLDLILIDGAITDAVVEDVANRLTTPFDPEPNRRLAAAHFGYEILGKKLSPLLAHSGS